MNNNGNILLKYIELKTGFSDDGPAWIGRVRESASGKTLYFNDCAFQRQHGVQGNYVDMESGEEYWISGVKKNGEDRHWAGHGKITIDSRVVEAYLTITGEKEIDARRFLVAEMEDRFPIERFHELQNSKNQCGK